MTHLSEQTTFSVQMNKPFKPPPSASAPAHLALDPTRPVDLQVALFKVTELLSQAKGRHTSKTLTAEQFQQIQALVQHASSLATRITMETPELSLQTQAAVETLKASVEVKFDALQLGLEEIRAAGRSYADVVAARLPRSASPN